MISILFRFLFIILLGLSTVLADEDDQNTIEGTVSSKEKGLPLQGANVELLGKGNQQYGATTDDNGSFIIDGVGDGNYKVSISFIGFEDLRR